ncbi:transcriptional regulator with XRE-family HTH domain [Xanthomonas arboricola]|nr:transcriptional regulator with XRE-family HTH domain [Xanthomonas cannabis]
MGISQNALARATGVPPRRINEIVLGKRGITADTAVRLAAALGTTERFWLITSWNKRIARWAICHHESSGWPLDPCNNERV